VTNLEDYTIHPHHKVNRRQRSTLPLRNVRLYLGCDVGNGSIRDRIAVWIVDTELALCDSAGCRHRVYNSCFDR
jgi:hypothetical protein